MVNDNGFNLNDLVPAASNPASESPIRGQLGDAIETRPKEIDVITLDNPRALINLIPPTHRAVILSTISSPDYQEAYSLYLQGEEHKLDKKVSPTKIDHALRYNLWTQYYQALETGAQLLTISRVCAGVTAPMTFDKIIRSQRVFWLLLPPTDYTVANRRAHSRGLDRLYQILDVDPISENGKANTALINLQIKIFALLDARLNGPIAHKHEITTKNVHLGITSEQVQKLYIDTQKEVEQMGEPDVVLRNKDIIEIQNHQKDYSR